MIRKHQSDDACTQPSATGPGNFAGKNGRYFTRSFRIVACHSDSAQCLDPAVAFLTELFLSKMWDFCVTRNNFLVYSLNSLMICKDSKP